MHIFCNSRQNPKSWHTNCCPGNPWHRHNVGKIQHARTHAHTHTHAGTHPNTCTRHQVLTLHKYGLTLTNRDFHSVVNTYLLMYYIKLMKELLKTLSEKPFTIDGEQKAVQVQDAIVYQPLTFSVTYLMAAWRHSNRSPRSSQPRAFSACSPSHSSR